MPLDHNIHLSGYKIGAMGRNQWWIEKIIMEKVVAIWGARVMILMRNGASPFFVY